MKNIKYLLLISLLMLSGISFAVQIDVSKIQPGELKVTNWRGLPVFIYKRNESEITQLQNTKMTDVDENSLFFTFQHAAKTYNNEFASALADGSRLVERKKLRSTRNDILVVLGVSSYHECVVIYRHEKHDFFDPCSKSEYGLDGRIINPNEREIYHLLVPPHLYNGEILVIGEDAEKNIKIIDFSPDIQSSNTSNGAKLVEALQWEKTDIIPQLLKDPKVLDYTTAAGATALHVAANRSTPEIVSSLIKAGFNVNQLTKEGITPLQIALIARREDNAIILIKNKAKIEDFCENGVCSKDTKKLLAQYFPKYSAEQINQYVSKLVSAADSP